MNGGNPIHSLRSNSGSIMIFALVIACVFGIGGVMVFESVVKQKESSFYYAENTKAFYLAEAGVEQITKELLNSTAAQVNTRLNSDRSQLSQSSFGDGKYFVRVQDCESIYSSMGVTQTDTAKRILTLDVAQDSIQYKVLGTSIQAIGSGGKPLDFFGKIKLYTSLDCGKNWKSLYGGKEISRYDTLTDTVKNRPKDSKIVMRITFDFDGVISGTKFNSHFDVRSDSPSKLFLLYKKGDTLPSIPAYASQDALEKYLTPYIEQVTVGGTVRFVLSKLTELQYIYLCEVNTYSILNLQDPIKYPLPAGYDKTRIDYQDAIVLLTFYPKKSDLTPSNQFTLRITGKTNRAEQSIEIKGFKSALDNSLHIAQWKEL